MGVESTLPRPVTENVGEVDFVGSGSHCRFVVSEVNSNAIDEMGKSQADGTSYYPPVFIPFFNTV